MLATWFDVPNSGLCVVMSPTALKATAVANVVRPARSAKPRSPLVMPVMAALTKLAHTGAAGPQMIAVAAICTIARQVWRRKLPTALKIGFQKQPRKQ